MGKHYDYISAIMTHLILFTLNYRETLSCQEFLWTKMIVKVLILEYLCTCGSLLPNFSYENFKSQHMLCLQVYVEDVKTRDFKLWCMPGPVMAF